MATMLVRHIGFLSSKGPSTDFQGRNEVCGIRDQMGGIWDHSHGIRDQKPRDQGSEGWDRDQQFSEGSRIRLYHF